MMRIANRGPASGLLAQFVAINQRLARLLDRFVVPDSWRIDGNAHFNREILPQHIKSNTAVLDVGGGKHPCIDTKERAARGIYLVGLDIDRTEIERAKNKYDRTIVADLTTYNGDGGFDLIVCRAVLEHVRDSVAALRGISSAMKPGGIALLFLPTSQALFAKLNLLLPQSFKERLLFALYPDMRAVAGFPAFYHNATVRGYATMCRDARLEIVETKRYFMSAYFHGFLPAWVVWRCYCFVRYLIDPRGYAETFALVLRKARD